MLFHSTEFLVFLAAFLLGFWLVRDSLRARNLLVIAASWLFYGWWDWRFLGLMVGTCLVDFAVALALDRASNSTVRRRWLWVSLGLNLGVLGVFKYLGFFVDSFHALLAEFGVAQPSRTWSILLPVGISFYTFQTLSYTLDVYHRRMAPTRDLPAFLAYVAFFPQLVAGPIERASHLLPQFQTTRVVRLADVEEGLWLVLWGLFKKVVVADHLAPFAELGFDTGPSSAHLTLLGVLAFAGQIYGDFSGYSDVARGLARWLGFDLGLNFRLPYLATDVREFWQRWHISLSTWLRDYLYVPLGGNRRGPGRTALNLFATMLLGGLWHGAAWNFVLWGAWHGVALVLQRARPARRPLPVVLAWPLTFGVVAYGWLLFRGGSLANLARLHASLAQWNPPSWWTDVALAVVVWWLPLVLVQIWQARSGDLLAPARAPRPVRLALEAFLIVALAAGWETTATPFLYFQF